MNLNQEKSRRDFLLKTPLVLYGTFMASKYLSKNFTVDEFKCKGTGRCEVVETFIERLQLIRDEYGRPIFVTSGYRAPEYNLKLQQQGKTKTGSYVPHTTGRAVDIAVSGADSHLIIKLATQHGMTGIGVSQKGKHEKRFIHLDDLTGSNRPWTWIY